MFYVVMRPEDCEACAAIHAESFAMAAVGNWSAEDLRGFLEGGGYGRVVRDSAQNLCGFILLRAVLDESEILTFAVAAAARGAGLGATLLQQAVADARARGQKMIFLEVASDNQAALKLYHGIGFIQKNIRKGYYDGVDGFILALDL